MWCGKSAGSDVKGNTKMKKLIVAAVSAAFVVSAFAGSASKDAAEPENSGSHVRSKEPSAPEEKWKKTAVH